MRKAGRTRVVGWLFVRKGGKGWGEDGSLLPERFHVRLSPGRAEGTEKTTGEYYTAKGR